MEIVIPERQRNVNISKILNEKRRWIEKILKLQSKNCPFHVKSETRPQLIACPAISETWKIVCHSSTLTTAVKLTNIDSEKTLFLTGNVDNFSACQKILIKWLIKKAKIHLTPWLEYLSAFTKLEFNRMIIRGQSTLWGSCNAKKTISLNYKLLFLPKPLVEHVLLHELCHTKHLNHSDDFWQLFKRFDPNCLEHKKALKTAEYYFPGWLIV